MINLGLAGESIQKVQNIEENLQFHGIKIQTTSFSNKVINL